MKKNQKSNRTLILGILIFTIVSMSFSFWIVSTQFSMELKPTFSSNDWDIRFLEYTLKFDIGGMTQVVSDPVKEGTYLTSFHAIFFRPGDYVFYTIEIENRGRIDALLSDVVKSTKPRCTGTGGSSLEDAKLVCDNLSYILTYEDTGIVVSAGDILDAGQKQTLKLKLSYSNQTSKTPINKVEITGLDVALIYIQK